MLQIIDYLQRGVPDRVPLIHIYLLIARQALTSMKVVAVRDDKIANLGDLSNRESNYEPSRLTPFASTA